MKLKRLTGGLLAGAMLVMSGCSLLQSGADRYDQYAKEMAEATQYTYEMSLSLESNAKNVKAVMGDADASDIEYKLTLDGGVDRENQMASIHVGMKVKQDGAKSDLDDLTTIIIAGDDTYIDVASLMKVFDVDTGEGYIKTTSDMDAYWNADSGTTPAMQTIQDAMSEHLSAAKPQYTKDGDSVTMTAENVDLAGMAKALSAAVEENADDIDDAMSGADEMGLGLTSDKLVDLFDGLEDSAEDYNMTLAATSTITKDENTYTQDMTIEFLAAEDEKADPLLLYTMTVHNSMELTKPEISIPTGNVTDLDDLTDPDAQSALWDAIDQGDDTDDPYANIDPGFGVEVEESQEPDTPAPSETAQPVTTQEPENNTSASRPVDSSSTLFETVEQDGRTFVRMKGEDGSYSMHEGSYASYVAATVLDDGEFLYLSDEYDLSGMGATKEDLSEQAEYFVESYAGDEATVKSVVYGDYFGFQAVVDTGDSEEVYLVVYKILDVGTNELVNFQGTDINQISELASFYLQ